MTPLRLGLRSSPEELDKDEDGEDGEAQAHVSGGSVGQRHVAVAGAHGHELRREAGDVGAREGVGGHGGEARRLVDVRARPGADRDGVGAKFSQGCEPRGLE